MLLNAVRRTLFLSSRVPENIEKQDSTRAEQGEEKGAVSCPLFGSESDQRGTIPDEVLGRKIRLFHAEHISNQVVTALAGPFLEWPSRLPRSASSLFVMELLGRKGGEFHRCDVMAPSGKVMNIPTLASQGNQNGTLAPFEQWESPHFQCRMNFLLVKTQRPGFPLLLPKFRLHADLREAIW